MANEGGVITIRTLDNNTQQKQIYTKTICGNKLHSASNATQPLPCTMLGLQGVVKYSNNISFRDLEETQA